MSETETSNQVHAQPSKKEIFFFYNTLTGLVKAIEGYYTVVDLRNESSVSGLIAKVDGYMNIEMEDVVYIDPTGSQHLFSQFFVRHRNIRYVHIPEGLSSKELMEEQITGMKRVKPKDKKRTFKQLRAQRYQKETVQSLNN